MTKQAATDAGIGRAVFATRLMLSLRAMSMSLLLGALPGFLLPYLVWRASATEQEIDVVRIGLVSAFADEKKPSRWEMRNADLTQKVNATVVRKGQQMWRVVILATEGKSPQTDAAVKLRKQFFDSID